MDPTENDDVREVVTKRIV